MLTRPKKHKNKISDSDIDTAWPLFLSENYGLIIQIAKQKLGRFDINEILGEACVAWTLCAKYHSKDCKTKDTSTFKWQFGNLLDQYRERAVMETYEEFPTERKKRRNGSYLDEKETEQFELMMNDSSCKEFQGTDENNLSAEERLYYNVPPIVSRRDPDPEGNQELPFGEKYLVCHKSFEDTGVFSSHDVLPILGHLSERRVRVNREQCENFLQSHRTIRAAGKQLRDKIFKQMPPDHKLWVATTMNGTRNNVLICAKTSVEAINYSKPYGAMLQLQQIKK